MKKLSLWFVLLGILLSFTGCSDDDKNSDVFAPPKWIIGEWQESSASKSIIGDSRWEFTKNEAVYSYSYTNNNIPSLCFFFLARELKDGLFEIEKITSTNDVYQIDWSNYYGQEFPMELTSIKFVKTSENQMKYIQFLKDGNELITHYRIDN